MQEAQSICLLHAYLHVAVLGSCSQGYLACILWSRNCCLHPVSESSLHADAAEVVPGLEPTPQKQVSPEHAPLCDSSGESIDSDDESAGSFSNLPSDNDSRQHSNKQASTSGKEDTPSVSDNGSSNGSSRRSNNNGKPGSIDGKGRSEQLKQAVSMAGSKMQQAVQDENTGIASRSGFEKLVQDGQFEAEELKKKAQQAVRHRLATETEAPQEKVGHF